MSDDLDDLRRETRVSIEKTISVKFVNESQGSQLEKHLCQSCDISAGGLKLISNYPLTLGDKLPMEIDLGSMWAVIDVVSEVKWCLEIDDAPTYYIGVKLINIEQSNRQVWKRFIASL